MKLKYILGFASALSLAMASAVTNQPARSSLIVMGVMLAFATIDQIAGHED